MSNDYLTEDTLFPSNQKFVCLSFLTPSPDSKKKSALVGIKIRGAFDTYDKACEHAKIVQSADQCFNVFVGEMGKWLPFDPDPNSKEGGDSEYANNELNDMMKSYQENQVKAKMFHEYRKNQKVRQNIEDNINTKKTNKKKLKKKLGKANTSDKKSISETLENVESQIKEMEEKHKSLETDDPSEQSVTV